MEDRWLKLEEILRRVLREELSTTFQQKGKAKVRFEGGKFVGLGPVEIAALEAAYPAVDVKQELLEAAAWIVMNPQDSPKSNYGAFINTWLKKHQNRSAIRSIPTRNDLLEQKRKHCAYCEAVATGNVGGRWACSTHMRDALDGKPPGHMWGVVAKPVAGNE
jgi:hypothetical protein